MGQPIQCNVCCAVDPPDPPIADCHQVICVAFIDENDPRSRGDRDDFTLKMSKFIEAYDSRILFVMDVTTGSSMYYPPNFISHDKAFSLKLEYDAGVAGIDRFIARSASYEDAQDVWDFMKKIVATKSAEVQALFNGATECAIFRDSSGSMNQKHVEQVYQKLRNNARADGVIPTASIYNGREDVICPFVVTQCCLNQAESDLRVLCGQSACDPVTIEWVKQPDGAFVVDDPCNPAAGIPNPDICESCPTVTTNQHTAKYTAAVKDGDGNILDFPTVKYTIQARNTSADSWQDIFELPNGFSGTEQSFDTLIKNFQNTTSDWGLLGQELTGTNRHDYLGASVDIDEVGRVIVIAEKTKVKVYHLVDEQWTQLGGDLGKAGENYSIASVSITRAGSAGLGSFYVAIGNPIHGESSSNTGEVLVYYFDGVSWTQVGSDLNGLNYDNFGFSVSIMKYNLGFLLAIGAPQYSKHLVLDDLPGINTAKGYVEVYEYQDGGSITKFGSTINGDNNYDQFGRSVSIGYAVGVGDTFNLVVGAPTHILDHEPPATMNGKGQVKVFQYDKGVSSDWTQIGSTIIGSRTSENLGESVDIGYRGTVIIVGSPIYGATVYDYTNSVWNKRGDHLMPPNFKLNSVSINSNISRTTIVLGGWKHKTLGTGDDGFAYVFQWVGTIAAGSWKNDAQGGLLVGDTRDVHVSIDNTGITIITGAPHHDENDVIDPTKNAGIAKAFRQGVTISTCHPLISEFGTPVSSCLQFTDSPIIGSNCFRRVFTREFRIKASATAGTIYSNKFNLYRLLFSNAQQGGGGGGGGVSGSFKLVNRFFGRENERGTHFGNSIAMTQPLKFWKNHKSTSMWPYVDKNAYYWRLAINEENYGNGFPRNYRADWKYRELGSLDEKNLSQFPNLIAYEIRERAEAAGTRKSPHGLGCSTVYAAKIENNGSFDFYNSGIIYNPMYPVIGIADFPWNYVKPMGARPHPSNPDDFRDTSGFGVRKFSWDGRLAYCDATYYHGDGEGVLVNYNDGDTGAFAEARYNTQAGTTYFSNPYTCLPLSIGETGPNAGETRYTLDNVSAGVIYPDDIVASRVKDGIVYTNRIRRDGPFGGSPGIKSDSMVTKNDGYPSLAEADNHNTVFLPGIFISNGMPKHYVGASVLANDFSTSFGMSNADAKATRYTQGLGFFQTSQGLYDNTKRLFPYYYQDRNKLGYQNLPHAFLSVRSNYDPNTIQHEAIHIERWELSADMINYGKFAGGSVGQEKWHRKSLINVAKKTPLGISADGTYFATVQNKTVTNNLRLGVIEVHYLLTISRTTQQPLATLDRRDPNTFKNAPSDRDTSGGSSQQTDGVPIPLENDVVYLREGLATQFRYNSRGLDNEGGIDVYMSSDFSMWAIIMRNAPPFSSGSTSADGNPGFIVALFSFDGTDFTFLQTLPNGPFTGSLGQDAETIFAASPSEQSSKNAIYYRDLTNSYQSSPTPQSQPVRIDSEFGNDNYVLVIGDHKFGTRNPFTGSYPSEETACRGMVEVYRFVTN